MRTILRDYTMSDGELATLAGDLVVFINRDATEFLSRGVDGIAITAFEALGNAFEVFPPDIYYQALVTSKIEAKNAARATATDLTQLISGFFEQKWGLTSWQYTQLGIKGLTSKSDDAFKTATRNVVSVATENLVELGTIGLVQANIDDLSAAVQTMETSYQDAQEQIALRDEKTEERTEKGNELYGFVTEYSAIGKLIWEHISEAKYNDYILYKSVHHGLSKPQNMTAVVDAGSPTHALIDFDVVAGATSYKIYESVVNIGDPSATFIYLTDSATNHFDAPMISGKRNYWKVRAFSAESTSSYSDEVYLDA